MSRPMIQVAVMDCMSGEVGEGKWFYDPTDMELIDNHFDRDVYYETYVILEVENVPFDVSKYDDADKIVDKLWDEMFKTIR